MFNSKFILIQIALVVSFGFLLSECLPQQAGPPILGGLIQPVLQDLPPRPYAFHYSVLSPVDGDFKSHSETRSAADNAVVGEYRIAQPDGCVRHVTYRASWEHGFVPEVRYSGDCDPAFYTAPEPVKEIPTAPL